MSFIEPADRIKALPPYLFKEIDRQRDEVAARGVDIIDLGVGDPDLPTPERIIAAGQRAMAEPRHHRYPSYSGMEKFRETAAAWFEGRFGVALDLNNVVTLIGSKEGVAHFPLAYVNPGDLVLAASPAYPVFATTAMFCGGEVHLVPLRGDNDFLPDLAAIPEDLAVRAKIFYVNYPNNPTGAVADLGFFERLADYCRRHRIILMHDAAYSEMWLDDFVPPSVLEVPGALDLAIEFHSLSKTYNMTGWRLGFAAGNSDLIANLGKVKSNIDSGAFEAVQMAGIEALTGDQSDVAEMRGIYRRRADILVAGLRGLGLDVKTPRATFYVWAPVPEGFTSARFASLLLTEAGVVCTPGNGFGDPGEGYVRFALCVPEARLQAAVERLGKINL
jgi:LL-diaminopimelate aminotransferase